jgi:diguanylate cyclase (GGDEF)-like protein
LLLGISPLSLAKPLKLEQGWQYRWGDSAFSSTGVPLWTAQPDHDAWQPISFPSNPPGRNGQENVWYRVNLPEGQWRDPVLYIYSVDLIVEVYIQGRRIYSYGQFDAKGKGQFIGWPWHMIDLPPDSVGQPIYFRIYSNYTDIGLWGEVMLLERMELYAKILRHSFDDLLIAALSLLIALLALLFSGPGRERSRLLGLSLFALSNSGMALGASQAKQLLIHWPLMWDYLAAGSYFLLPVAMAQLLASWGPIAQQHLLRRIQGFFLFYFVGALVLSGMDLISLAHCYPLFDLLFALALPLILGPLCWRLREMDADWRAICLASSLLGLLLLVDMAVAHSLLPWGRVPVAWGVLLFCLAIIGISLRHYAATQTALMRLNSTLELEVAKRTAELKQLVQREARRAKALQLSHEKNLHMGELLVELEQQPGMEQAIALLLERLPDFSPSLPGALYVFEAAEGQFALRQSWQTEDLPHRLQDQDDLPGWHCFALDYSHPGQGRLQLARFCLDFSPLRQADAALDPTSLRELTEQGMERISLSLSRLCLQQELQRVSYEDGLTGLNNRRYLDEMLPREMQLARRQRRPLSVLICDLDFFKKFNDKHGHIAGDEALRTLAAQLRKSFRQTDLLCRYGGEEFVVILPGADSAECRRRAEQLRGNLAQVEVMFEGQALGRLSLSIGICSWPEQDDDPRQLLQRADAALYQAKQQGRDRVISCG